MKRTFDISLSFSMLVFLSLPILLLAVIIKLTSSGPAFYKDNRIGRHNCSFKMLKFRSMVDTTPQKATHLLENPQQWITPLGKFLRGTSLDEIPQLWNILKGDMSFVGPRPALFNQADLISLREMKNIQSLRPGLTGFAQINGRDDLTIEEKVLYDEEYLENMSFLMDLKILFRTVFFVLSRKSVSH